MSASEDGSVISTVASRDSLEIIESPQKSYGCRTQVGSDEDKVRPLDAWSEKKRSSSDAWSSDKRRRPLYFDDVDEKKRPLEDVLEAAPPPPSSSAEARRREGLDDMVDFMSFSGRHGGPTLRRFEAVNLRHLLEMEREIWELEGRRGDLVGCELVREEEVRGLEREMRVRVREYYKAMLLTKRVFELEKPTQRMLDSARRAFPPIFGQSEWILSKVHNVEGEADLVTLAPRGDSDVLTRLFERLASGKNVVRVVTFISAMCAVLFLVGAVVGLYYVSNMKARLGMVGTFTVLFAVTIAGLTNSRRQEVFVATAAYAAVLVVFVSGNISTRPEPTVCVLSNGNSQAAAANALSSTTAWTPTTVQSAAATVTAVYTVTQSYSGSLRTTVVSTVVSTALSSPSVVVQKAEMSTMAKAGIGVGAAVGVLFCLMVLSGALMWARDKKWSGPEGVFSMFSSKKPKEGGEAEGGVWGLSFSKSREQRRRERMAAMDGRRRERRREERKKEKDKAEVGLDEKENDGPSTWV